MKKNILCLVALASFLVLSSCGGSEDPPPHIVGKWNLETFIYINMPPGYSRSEGLQITPGTFGISSMVWEINDGGEFIEKVTPIQGVSNNSLGQWSIANDELSIIYSDQADETVLNIDKNELDQLWVSRSDFQDILIADETSDSIINHHGGEVAANTWLTTWLSAYDSNVPAHVDTFNMVFDQVTFDLQFAFARAD